MALSRKNLLPALMLSLLAAPSVAQAARQSSQAQVFYDILPADHEPTLPLAVEYQSKEIVFRMSASGPGFAALLLSPTADLRHSFVGLPPLLAEGTVVALAKIDGEGVRFGLPRPTELLVHGYAQGVAIDADGIQSSAVQPLGLQR